MGPRVGIVGASRRALAHHRSLARSVREAAGPLRDRTGSAYERPRRLSTNGRPFFQSRSNSLIVASSRAIHFQTFLPSTLRGVLYRFRTATSSAPTYVAG